MLTNRDIIDSSIGHRYLSYGAYSDQTLDLIAETQDRIWQELTSGKTPLSPGQPRKLEQIVGIPGTGKSYYLNDLLLDPYHAAHSVVIDPDDIRKRTGFFDAAVKSEMEKGANFDEADRTALLEWQPANLSILVNLLNAASNCNFGILRTGNPAGPITNAILENAESTGFRVKTTLVHAPLDVCKEAVRLRVEQGGHPSNMINQDQSHDRLLDKLPDLFRRSHEISLRWRTAVSAPSVPVAKVAEGSLVTLDPKGLKSLMATFGKAHAGRNLDYLCRLHAARFEDMSLRNGC